MILRQLNPLQSAAAALSGDTFPECDLPSYEERLLMGWGPQMIRKGTKRWRKIGAATPAMASQDITEWVEIWQSEHAVWEDFVDKQCQQAIREGYVQNPYGRRMYTRQRADVCEFLLFSTAFDDLKVAISKAEPVIEDLSFGFVRVASEEDLARLRAVKTLIPWEN